MYLYIINEHQTDISYSVWSFSSWQLQNCFVSCVQHFVFFTDRVESIGTVLLGFKKAPFLTNLTTQTDLSS